MGVVFKQSLSNTMVTYLGFGIGALNTLVLYLHFMTPEYYGLVNVVMSAAMVLMPVLAFGVPNTLVKFYSSFTNDDSRDGFMTLMIFLPLVMVVPIAGITVLANETIGNFLSKENTIVKDYVWSIFFIGMAMAYFEVFYAWARVRMRSVFGNFMKEVFPRVLITVLLIFLFLDVLSVDVFIPIAVGIYLLRALIMALYAFKIYRFRFIFTLPKDLGNILKYSALIILGGSAAVVLLEIDKVMLNQFIEIENVAYYSVAGFIAMVIAVPSRSMHQITYPLTAELLNRKDRSSLKELYERSSLTLFIVSGLLFILILLNLNDLYKMLPEAYGKGFVIFVWLGLAKVYDALLGNNNSILYNSDYYRAILFMGVFLAVLTIVLNLWLIPEYGLDGAAIASFLAFFIYNTVKLLYVKTKFNILPFTSETIKVFALLLGIGGLFAMVNFPFHPIFNILLKSILISGLYVAILYRFKISKDIFIALSRILKK